MIPTTELPLAAATPAPAPSSDKAAPNTLTLKQRVALMGWCEERRGACASETDSDLAADATADLQFHVTGGNITGMRRQLEIVKTKPAAVTGPADIDLVALKAKVDAHDLQLAPLEALNLAQALTALRNHLEALETRVKSLEASSD